jgi:glycine/D-amino acid oxidase-like deaminating enzyme
MLMNPAALTRGLAGSLPRERDAVASTRRSCASPTTNGVRLETAQGSVYVPKLILCTNGFAEMFGYFQRQLLVFRRLRQPQPAADPTWNARPSAARTIGA